MDVIKINTTDFYPLALIENVDSLIWTERYSNAGEFEMRSYDISTILFLLPIDPISLISLVDSREVMIVESHDVQVDDNGVKILVTKGRSLVTFLEQRMIWGLSNSPYQMLDNYTAYGAIMTIMWNVLCNTSVNDVVNGTNSHDAGEAVPNVAISDSTKIALAGGIHWLRVGYAYEKILSILQYNDLGLRTIRPDTASASIVTIGTGIGGTTRGHLTRTTTSNVTKLLFNCYDGANRTVNQAVNPQIVFGYDQGIVVDPEYLWTNLQKKTVGYFTSTLGFGPLYNDLGLSYSGFKLRQYLFDAGSDYGGDINDVENAVIDQVAATVKKSRRIFVFNSTISPNVPFTYGVDYFLGDLITLRAEYGVNVTARISEYVRTQDSSGAKVDYPTLSWDGT